jgi:hypothetical protein
MVEKASEGGSPQNVEILKKDDGTTDLEQLFRAAGEYVVKPLAEANANAEVEKAKASAGVQIKLAERDTARLSYLKTHATGRFVLLGLVAICTAGVIAYAIQRDQASVAMELIKTIASLGAVAFGGYGLAKSRKE